MTHYDDPKQDWVLFERIARSLAHRVGNASNVVNGRLSLIESTDDARTRESIQRARKRLMELDEDLHRVLAFAGHRPADPPEDLLALLRSLASPGVLQITGLEEASRSEAAPVQARHALTTLRDACRFAHDGKELVWSVEVDQQRTTPTIVIGIALDAQVSPADRRTLLEPWFAEGPQPEPSVRHKRLGLAQALGLAEQAGARIRVEETPDSTLGTRVTLSWPAGAPS